MCLAVVHGDCCLTAGQRPCQLLCGRLWGCLAKAQTRPPPCVVAAAVAVAVAGAFVAAATAVAAAVEGELDPAQLLLVVLPPPCQLPHQLRPRGPAAFADCPPGALWLF